MSEQRPTPETDDIFDAYARCACGTACIRAKMQQIERERDSAKSLNKTLLDQLEAQAALLEAVRHERDNTWEKLEAMREAIKEAWIEIQYAEAGFAGLALRVCPNDSAVESVLNHTTEALAKLTPLLP